MPETAKALAYYKQKYWDWFAPVYDISVKLNLSPFGGEKKMRRQVIAFAGPMEGYKVLDACCGTGTLTSLIAEAVGSSGAVTGVDLSSKMIARARKKMKDSPVVTFQRANIEELPFPDDMFDRSFISFGLHEMPEAARHNTLKELYRTLAPGASLFAVDYNLARGIAGFGVKTFVKLFETKPAYRMLLADTLLREIEQAGFSLEARKTLVGGVFQVFHARKPSGEGGGDGRE